MIPATELLRYFRDLTIEDWRVSRDGAPGQAVIDAHCGYQAPRLWLETRFSDSDGEHTLRAERMLSGPAATIQFDGQALSGEMHIRGHAHLLSEGIEVSVEAAGLPAYRLDGKVQFL